MNRSKLLIALAIVVVLVINAITVFTNFYLTCKIIIGVCFLMIFIAVYNILEDIDGRN